MSAGLGSPRHAANVIKLYKTCLKLHRGLPLHLKAIGDSYVRDEFKRHKSASKEHADVFVQEWAKYALTLSKQLQAKNLRSIQVGQSLKEEDLGHFSDEQLVQLYELYQEANKPQKDME